MYPQAQITGTSPKFPLPRRFALKATTAAATLNQHEASLSQDGEWLLWGHSLNVPHPVSGLSSAAEQPNYSGFCFEGNRTGCQYY